MVKKVRSQIAVRINDADTITRFDVLENQVAKECCLACSALSDGVEMMPPVFRKKNEGRFLPPFLTDS